MPPELGERVIAAYNFINKLQNVTLHTFYILLSIILWLAFCTYVLYFCIFLFYSTNMEPEIIDVLI